MKGILLKPDMIQAIVEGRKTQTRRAEKGLGVINLHPDKWRLGKSSTLWHFEDNRGCGVLVKPRYHAGETVYIKEAWRTEALYDLTPPSDIGSDALIEYRLSPDDILSRIMGRWRSPLHLPECSARHFITITGVRAERLQEITEEDARAEGISQEYIFKNGLYLEDGYSYRRAYRRLWNFINPKYPWESNPWVFAYTFRQEIPQTYHGPK